MLKSGNTPADDKIWVSCRTFGTYIMSLNGTVTTYDIDPPKIYDDPCVVQQHDGKLLILGKYGIALTSLTKPYYFQDNFLHFRWVGW